jgi:predicted RNA binding protein YcfA (HicA-like mRNA interferase family)
MRLPRNVSGQQLAAALCRHWNYVLVHQRGSHVILQTDDPSHHRVAVPAHDALRIGTLNNILRAIAEHKGASRDDILDTL